MANTHYLRREKEGRLIQLIVALRLQDEFGTFTRTIKYAVDERYKKEISYLACYLPHEELMEISFEEFCELCSRHNILTPENIPPPALSSDGNVLVSKHGP